MGANSKAPEDVAREPHPLLAQVRGKFKKAKPTAVPRIPLDQRLVDPSSLEKEESLESTPSPARTTNPDDPNEDDEMQAGGNQDAASASNSSDNNSSSASVIDEDLFIDKLVQLVSIGELSTKEEVLDVYLNNFGDYPEVSVDFVYNLTRRLAQRPETPFETIIKDYQEKQDDLMAEQRSIIRNEMANLHRIMADQTANNSAEIAKAMQAACDLKDKELILLRTELKRLKLANTLLNTDHALLKQKLAAQNLCNEKDSVIFLMEEKIELHRDAIQTQGLNFPDETPRNAPAPAPSTQSMASPPSSNREKDTVPGLHYGPESTDPGLGNIRRDDIPILEQDHGWGLHDRQ
jgi:hypothetical protein